MVFLPLPGRGRVESPPEGGRGEGEGEMKGEEGSSRCAAAGRRVRRRYGSSAGGPCISAPMGSPAPSWRAQGPRSSGEWWLDSRWVSDEWDVELADGTLGRLAHDGSTWMLEGIYD